MSAQNIYTIYKATCIINGKSYVGFDSNWPNRIKTHKHISIHKKDQAYFHKAIRKHGWPNFEWEILYQSSDRDYMLNEMENHFIKEYQTHVSEGGYNLTYGGEGFPKPHTEETKKKISLGLMGIPPWNKGKTGVFSKDALHKIGAPGRLPKSEETKRKMAEARAAWWDRKKLRVSTV